MTAKTSVLKLPSSQGPQQEKWKFKTTRIVTFMLLKDTGPVRVAGLSLIQQLLNNYEEN
jgi:hypothetical protein